MIKKIAIFASGNGSNAQRIAEYFRDNDKIKVRTIITNKKDAYVIERAQNLGIPCKYFSKTDFYEGDVVLDYLLEEGIDFIVLAGFLWLIPGNILKHYGNNHIINIHPALLPKYGGKGMYGMHVHDEVIAQKEKESGISIHFVNEKYDEGRIIFQARCTLSPEETPESLAKKIHVLEYEYFPKVIENVINGNI